MSIVDFDNTIEFGQPSLWVWSDGSITEHSSHEAGICDRDPEFYAKQGWAAAWEFFASRPGAARVQLYPVDGAVAYATYGELSEAASRALRGLLESMCQANILCLDNGMLTESVVEQASFNRGSSLDFGNGQRDFLWVWDGGTMLVTGRDDLDKVASSPALGEYFTIRQHQDKQIVAHNHDRTGRMWTGSFDTSSNVVTIIPPYGEAHTLPPETLVNEVEGRFPVIDILFYPNTGKPYSVYAMELQEQEEVTPEEVPTYGDMSPSPTVTLTVDEIELDQNFFDENNHLHQDVREVLLKVVDDITKDLTGKDFALIPEFIILTGSLTGPNWDEFSDVDLHLGINFQQFSDIDLSRKYLGCYAADFNHQGYNLIGRSLEIYFQDVFEPHNTPGIYDVVNDHWAKVPDGLKIEVNKEAKDAADTFRIEVADLVAEYEQLSKKEAGLFLEKLMAYWQGIRKMRKEELQKAGRESFGNQVFKMLRRNGMIQALMDLVHQVRDDVYEVVRDE